MNVLGVDGYRDKHGQVTTAREIIEAGVRARGFTVIGQPKLGILAFTRDDVDCMAILGQLYGRGWVTSATSQPRGLHLMLSPVHLSVAQQYFIMKRHGAEVNLFGNILDSFKRKPKQAEPTKS